LWYNHKSGNNDNHHLLNKKVAFLDNSWSTHVIKNVNKVWIVDDTIDFKTAAFFIGNPLTVAGLM
jgi:hypothetical protein